MCEYCEGKGKIEMDNNGPIVDCPVCESSALTGLLYASLTAMSYDGVGTLNCSHVDTVSGAPNCCTSCHDGHDMGFDSLYEDADDKIPVQHCLCCAKRNWLTGI